MRITYLLIGLALFSCSSASVAQDTQPGQLSTARPSLPIEGVLDSFASLYQTEWGQVSPCTEPNLDEFKVCSSVLRNEGNAPFILYGQQHTGKVAILLHGLSDSPYFMRGVAEVLNSQGFTVLVPLLPGHGLRDADADMQDSQIAERWQHHVNDIMGLATQLGETVWVGGFSTGGALAVNHYLSHPDSIDALMLFSGALALSDNAESMSRFWGIKWLARFNDGEYQTHGPNPHKYPRVAGFSGLELMDIINQIRAEFESGKRIKVPVFAAHSQADTTTPIHGVENLMIHTENTNTFFIIDESYDLCHADIVLNHKLLADMHFDKTEVTKLDKCAIPEANPLYRQMINMLRTFVSLHTDAVP